MIVRNEWMRFGVMGYLLYLLIEFFQKPFCRLSIAENPEDIVDGFLQISLRSLCEYDPVLHPVNRSRAR